MKTLLLLIISVSYMACPAEKHDFECPECPNTSTTTTITKEIYRGKVTLIDDQDRRLISLYGTNQSIWSEDHSLSENDIVEVVTEDNLENYKINILCSPVYEHCHHNGVGIHKRMHIWMMQSTGNPQSTTYNGKNYIVANMRKLNGVATTMYVEENFEFISADYETDPRRDPSFDPSTDPSTIFVHGLVLKDQTGKNLRINGHLLLIDFTNEEHTH